MKRILLIIFLLTSGITKGQNIVPNPSFEVLDSICPLSYFISYSYLWESANAASPDIFDTCAGIPDNNAGYQYAHTGKGMAGLVTKGPNNYREYIEIKLDSALKDAHDYCVEFWISMANESQLATYPPQVYFSDTFIDSSPSITTLNFTPQFKDTSLMVTDTANWVKISGTFNSLCNCQYMLIGNFYNDANTDTLQIKPSYLSAYYYIDDVSITECFPAKVDQHEMKAALKVYPNPAPEDMNVSLSGTEKIKSMVLSDIYGREVRSIDGANATKLTIDCRELVNGMYFLQVRGNAGGVYSKRVVVRQ